MKLAEFLGNQTREALGAVNKWYCSQYFGFEVTDPDTLLTYYIKHGGAKHYRATVGARIPSERIHSR